MADGAIFDQTQEAALTAADRFLVQQTSAATPSTSATFALMGGMETKVSAPGTTTDTDALVGEFHWLDISSLTTGDFRLPASAQLGERVGVGISVTNATAGNELELFSNSASDLINGVDHSSTSWSFPILVSILAIA